MGIHPDTKESVSDTAIEIQTTQYPEKPLSFNHSHDLDQFKFRLVEQGQKHYFKDVRFKAPHLSPDDEQEIVQFFEGRNLECLSPELMAAGLGKMAILSELQSLIGELQVVLCD